MMRLVKRLLKDEAGLEPVEYALMLALFAIVAVVGAITLANSVSGKYGEIAATLDATNNAGDLDG